MVSLILFLVACVIGVSILFYHVSAVRIYEKDQQTKFITLVQSSHNLQRCSWISDVIIKEKVITLRCDNPSTGNLYYFFNEQFQKLSELDPTEVHPEAAKAAFIQSSGVQDPQITLTYYDDGPVFWITASSYEWLIDIKTYEILWKVDKNYD